MKLLFNEAFSLEGLSATETLASERKGGGAKHDGMLFELSTRLIPFALSLADSEHEAGKVILTDLIENEEYTALTGIDGLHGFYVAVSATETVGPLGAPSLAKIMTDGNLGMADVFIARPVIAKVWNNTSKKSAARKALADALKNSMRTFSEKGNPFNKFRASDENAEVEA